MLASYIGARHAVAVVNGTAALHLAYLVSGVGPGDEVIMPALTFVSCPAMAVACGATPRFADCDPATLGLSPASVRAAITKRTKAILPVHLFGNSCEMDELLELSERSGLRIIEDAAESLGTTYGGRHVGTLGQIGCFSFHAAKTVTMGEGGMVVTDDGDLADKVRLLRNHGSRPGLQYWHDVVGFNYRLTNMQAAIGCAQLERVEEILASRARIEACYRTHLARVPGVRIPSSPPKTRRVLWAQPIVLDRRIFPQGREAVRDALRLKGIETRPMFYPAYSLPPYRKFEAHCPVTEDVSTWALTLPVFERLTDDQVAYVCRSLGDLAS